MVRAFVIFRVGMSSFTACAVVLNVGYADGGAQLPEGGAAGAGGWSIDGRVMAIVTTWSPRRRFFRSTHS